MSGKWKDSSRRGQLPAGWSAIRERVKARANGQCQGILPSGKQCPRRGTDAHHAAGADNHDWITMLWLCPYHHGQETAKEAQRWRQPKVEVRHPGDRSM